VRILFKIVDKITDLGAWLSALSLGIIVASFWIEVVGRYFFNAPTSWTASVSLYLLMTMVCLVLPWLTREGRHVTMTFVFEKASARAIAPLALAMSVTACAICLIAAYFASIETLRQFDSNVRSPDAMLFAMWRLTALMVYAFFFSALHFARHAMTGVVPRHWEG
jgi:TRAP-type C4-dicarboxylate transport system permease small subunit